MLVSPRANGGLAKKLSSCRLTKKEKGNIMATRKKTAKKAAAKPRKKKSTTSKASELSQTHAKVEGRRPTTLDQIWGDTGMHKYKTLDEQEYKQQLKEMHKVDLQAHAVEIGLIPIDNPEQLKRRLLVEFKKYATAYKIPEITSNNDKAELSREVQNILNEGK